MYDAATLDDIAMRLKKGWVIRADETRMLIHMATELLIRTNVAGLSQPAQGSNQAKPFWTTSTP